VYNMDYIKVEGHHGFVRDKTGAILNVNKEEIEAAKKRKAERKKQQNEINELKNEVSDIKQMLTKIVEKLNG
tara:strand:- start:185 stop:400 length:216 start_codon:yes stop_codon:yes gene_type:complete